MPIPTATNSIALKVITTDLETCYDSHKIYSVKDYHCIQF